MMEEEEFDEFEEATYSHSEPNVQKTSPSPHYLTHAAPGLEPPHDGHAPDPIGPPSGPLPSPISTGSL